MNKNLSYIYQISIAINHTLSVFDYQCEEVLSAGQVVSVELKNKEYLGVVISNDESEFSLDKIKSIRHVFQGYILSNGVLEFIGKIAKYTMQNYGAFLRLYLQKQDLYKEASTKIITLNSESDHPGISKKGQEIYDYLLENKKASLGLLKEKFSNYSLKNLIDKNILIQNEEVIPEVDEKYSFNLVDLNESQNKIFKQIKATMQDNGTMLLHGVTGSGKTEIYLHFIREIIEESGGQILILLPEIMLTNELVNRITERIGKKPLVWHSKVSAKDKRKIFQKIICGKDAVIVGARSALFLPYKNLSAIIVDEEHDGSYKQDEGLCYNARDFAIWFSHFLKKPIILSSATPSVESYYNARVGRYKYLNLSERHKRIKQADIDIIDLKQEKMPKDRFVTDKLMHAISRELNNNRQVALFLNRKGFAPITICSSCGQNVKCNNCSTNLVYHKSKGRLICHHCDYSRIFVDHCDSCDAKGSYRFCGAGIDKIYEEVSNYFPDKNIICLSSDENAESISDKIRKIHDQNVDIAIGTQLISKGYHFSNVTLVGVIDADLGILGADVRSGEKMFQVINQVVGRSGRELEGRAVIQTYYPESKILDAIKNHNSESFYKSELQQRKELDMPPFGRLASIIISGTDKTKVEDFLRVLRGNIPYQDIVEILGPVESVIYRLRNNYRYRFLLKSSSNVNLQQIIQEWISKLTVPNNIRLKIDVDPYNFL